MTFSLRALTRHACLVTLACTLLSSASPRSALAQDTSALPTSTSPDTADVLEDAKKSVGALLLGHHHQPSPEHIEAASPHARAALLALALDQDLFLLHRRRALTALITTWPDDANLKVLEGLVATEDEALVLESLNLLTTHYDARGVEVLTSTLLDSPYPSHRRAAIHALGQLPDATQSSLMARALDREQDPDLRTLLTFKAKDLGI